MKKSLLLIMAAAALTAACNQQTSKPQAQQEQPAVQEKVSKVTTVVATTMDVPQTEVYTSTVQAYATNNIAPQSGGRIQKINAEVGDYVYAGKVLAEMDRVQLEQARLKLVNDSTELVRLRGLYQEGGVSQSDFETVEMAYNVSCTTYKNLLENTILRSPINGVVTARNYDKGDMYGMAQPIFVVQQISPVKLLVGISESEYTRVKRGDGVEITVEALPGRVFNGSIRRLYPTIDPASHTFQTEVIVNNADRALRPGMFAKAKVSFGVNHSVVVPDAAVVKQQGSGQRSVFVLGEDNTVTSVVVTLGRHFDRFYEILSGIEEGAEVVVKGNSSLKNGQKVEVVQG